jgi:hypothetical protein
MADRSPIAVGIVEVLQPERRVKRAVRRRLFGPWRLLFAVHVLAMLLVYPVMLFVGLSALPDNAGSWRLVVISGLALVQGAIHYGINRWAGERIVRRWSKRGIEPNQAVSFNVTPAGLLIATEAVAATVAWKSIIDIWREEGFWVLLLSTGSVVSVPQRFFDTDQAEWAFMTLLLDHLDPHVRARSPDVQAFDGPAPGVSA